jgi:biofilm PGA synthesis N-glycosyltransferase PgaC
MSKKPWNVKIDQAYRPRVAIIVPVHNEEKAIQLKLRNLQRVRYPHDKFEVIIANDASTDRTIAEVESFNVHNSNLNIRVVSVENHIGKTTCLNLALKSLDTDVVVVSDADCFWPADILEKTVPFLADPKVGAVCAKEMILNPEGSWVTKGEEFYDDTMEAIRVGESKIHSTIVFHGGFAVFKRSALDQFDPEVDDSGTAFGIIQKDQRTLLLSETGFYTPFPMIWKNKLSIKIRRATQLQHIYAKCLSLLIRGKLKIPKRIAVPEIFLHIFNPLLLVIFLALMVAGTIIERNMLFAGFVVLLFLGSLIFKKSRTIVFEVLQHNLILLAALSSFFTKKGFRLWKSVEETRNFITEESLSKNGLI